MKTNVRGSLIQTCLLAAALLALPAAVQAQFTYTTANGAITITGYTGSGGVVTIPSTINGLPVTGIGADAFYESWNLTSVTIGNSVTSIGNEAFEDCIGLTNIAIPASVTSIGNYAFSACYFLTNCTIGEGVTNIGNFVFIGCHSLTAITVAAQNPSYSSVNGVLFNKSQTTLVIYPGGLGGNYTIPDSVTSIGYGAFVDCEGLTSITIGNSVTNIGDEAFANCSLVSVTIGNSVTSIGNYAFDSCYNLTSVTIPDSVTSIGDEALSETSSLTNVIIGSGVTNIGNAAFLECPVLTAILVIAQNSFYSSVNGVLFDKSQSTLIAFPSGLGGSYTISDSVTNIGDDAFEDCEDLTNVTIGNGVTTIGDAAFDYCSSLASVTIGNSLTNISDYAFADCYSLTSVYFAGNAPAVVNSLFILNTGGDPIRDGSFIGDSPVIYYLPGTTGWSNTFAGYGNVHSYGLPTALWLPQAQTGDGNFGVRTNQFGFNIAWASGQTVVVEACTNLSTPIWVPVSTNTLVGGTSYFIDPQPANLPGRFYRLRSP
jgi:BspA type Leucine rich repeat region (6 copies)